MYGRIPHFLAIFLCAFTALQSQLIEFYADWAWNAKGNKLFTPPAGAREEDWSSLHKIQSLMREKGWEIQSWDYEFYRPLLLKGSPPSLNTLPPDSSKSLWVFWNLGGKMKELDLSRIPKERLVLFMWEPPTVEPRVYTKEIQDLFGKIFTWDDDLVDNRKFFKFNYTNLRKRINSIPDFNQKKFCVMINSCLHSRYPKELYSERENVIRFFEDKPGEFDLFGRNWKDFKNWKGTTKHKLATLSQYRFCICYENTRDIKGYITEKIFDCFAAGCVPIYWGASNVTDYIPPECFIDRRHFKSTNEVYLYLKQMDQREYDRYLENAARYITSEQAKIFSRDALVKLFMDELIK